MKRLVICLLTASLLAMGQKPTPPSDAKVRIASIFGRYDRADTPGCAVGVSIDGAPAFSAAYGMADLEHQVALTPSSVFEAGSVSKQFTATAVLLLAQQGKLSVDDPVRKYIPEVPDYGAPVTIRHLLNHTSGLRDWGSLESIAGWPRTTRSYTHAHVLDIISRQRALNYPPGAVYSYSNSGYNLAAILVGRVSGKTFAELTKQAIFTPLDMASTEWRDDFRRIVRNRAIAYLDTGGTVRQNMPFEDVHGNGGLLTTVGDLLRWNHSFRDFKLGGQALFDAQHRRGRLNDGKNIAYAAGLMMLTWKGLPEVSHSGSTAGYRAWLARYPEQDLSVAVLCNAASANATELGHQVADVFLGSAVQPLNFEARGLFDPAARTARAGAYRSTRTHEILTIQTSGVQLRAGSRLLLSVAPNVFMTAEGMWGTARGTWALFENDGRLRISSALDPDHVYEKVNLVNPTRAELVALAGEYTSDEAEVTLRVAMDGDSLVIHRRPASKFTLTPTYRDGFGSSLVRVRFLRDGNGRVNEMSIGEARVWDLRFKRK